MQKFKPDQLVLVKESPASNWDLARYSYFMEGDFKGRVHHIQGYKWFKDEEILPYSGNEHLLGTKNLPELKWKPKHGELVAVRNSLDEKWKVRVFYNGYINTSFMCYSENEKSKIISWKFCEPLNKHFNIPE